MSRRTAPREEEETGNGAKEEVKIRGRFADFVRNYGGVGRAMGNGGGVGGWGMEAAGWEDRKKKRFVGLECVIDGKGG